MLDAVCFRRFSLTAILISAAVLALPGCGGGRRGAVGGHDCASGVGSRDRNHPLVCIDDSTATLTADPEKIRIHDMQGKPGGPPSHVPVLVRWQTRSGGGDLAIDFDAQNKGCLGKVQCNHNGECTAVALKQTAMKPCSYTMNLEGKITDPVVVVDPCCGNVNADNP